MRFENEGMVLWYALPDTPASSETVSAGEEVTITIGVEPADASNKVELLYSINQGPPQAAVAKPVRHTGNTQYFKATLPAAAFRPGDMVRYTAVCRCAGRQVPSRDEEQQFTATFRIADPGARPALEQRADPQGHASVPITAAPSVLQPQAPSVSIPLPASVSQPMPQPPHASMSYLVPQPPPASAPRPPPASAPPLPLASVSLPPPPSPSLHELATTLELAVPRELVSTLSQHGILTLGDIRDAGGIAHLSGLSAVDSGVVKLLEAHAELSRLSPDLHTNATLIAKGYISALAIANASQPGFVAATHEQLGDFRAAQLHVAARTQVSVLNNLLTGMMADAFRGGASQTVDLPGSSIPGVPLPCACEDCQAAASPAAYLADLLDYAVKHLRTSGAAITIDFLTNTFLQPFGDLPTACEAVERQVRQVRICIEVLRSYLYAHFPTSTQQTVLKKAEAEYCLAAYTALLNRIGTSFEEIRLVRGDNRAKREALAERLGIDIAPVGSSRPDHLDALYLDPSSSLTEEALDWLFGFTDTTRNPLSEQLTLGDPEGQIARCHLDGVDWGRNTDGDGMIYVSLKQTAQGAIRIELYRDAQRTQVVSVGDALTPVDNVRLYQQFGSGLDGNVNVAYIADNSAIILVVFPQLLIWRLQHLRSLWEEEDRPADPYTEGQSTAELQALPLGIQFPVALLPKIHYDTVNRVLIFSGVMEPAEEGTLLGLSGNTTYQTAVKSLFIGSQRPPIIDPDVIGPDDLRSPFPKANTSDPDRAFDIWIKRRDWVDAGMKALSGMTRAVNGPPVPNLDAMILAMYGQVTYGAINVIPWANTTPSSELDTLSENLTQGIDIEATGLRIQTDLGLTVGSFTRLMDVRAKDQAVRDDPRNETVSNDEWREVASILVQAQKTRLFPSWRKEEQARGIAFGPKDFWISLREPQVGDWPPVIPDGQPLIDPEAVQLNDLPEPTAGQRALNIWESRRGELGMVNKELQVERKANGFDGMLRRALGHPNAGNPLQDDVTKLRQDRLDTNPAVVADATSRINNHLHMTVDAFNRLMTMKGKDPLKKLTAAEWSEVYAILTSADKAKHGFPTWIMKEQDASGVVYWSARKAKLPPWRAPAEARQAWQTALHNRSAAPIIDPDLINPDDLKHPVAGDPAYEMWNSRGQWIKTLEVPTVPTDLGMLDFSISDALGVPGTELESLDADQAKGNSLDGRLAQLGLSPEAFAYLVRIRTLVKSSALLESEWKNANSILTQVTKSREYARWREAEAKQHIVLGPDQFQIPEPPSDTLGTQTPAPLPAWRATRNARLDWQDALQSRIDQQNAVVSGLQQAVDATEEATLWQLRDALIMATDAPGTDLAMNAKWLTDNLLIDTSDGSCLKTTRIEQAIETLQDVFFALRTGHLNGLVTLPESLNSHFDEEWKWMGSYATWRAAVLVWMYPENVLQPSLRKWQTPGFRKLVQDVRANPHLTPDEACKAARDYSDYFRDVCTLSIEASCRVWSRMDNEAGCTASPIPIYTWLLDMFGRGGATNRVYWSSWDETDSSGYAQSFWEVVPGLEGLNIINIAGATPFWVSAGKRYVFVFFRAQESGVNKLWYTRYDPESRSWDNKVFPLDLRGNWTSFTVSMGFQNGEGDPPRIGITLPDGIAYERQLNRAGDGWAISDWVQLNTWGPWIKINDSIGATKITAVSRGPDQIDLFWSQGAGHPGKVEGTINSAWWNANANNGQWNPPFQIDPDFHGGFGSVTVLARSPNKFDLFVVGAHSAVWWNWWDSDRDQGRWHKWSQISPNQYAVDYATVAAVSLNANNMNLFVVGNGGVAGQPNTVWATWRDESPGNEHWHDWFPVHPSNPVHTLSPNVTAIARNPGHIDLFVVGDDGRIRSTWWDALQDPTWGQPWRVVIGMKTDDNQYITAVTRFADHLDLFVGDDYGPHGEAPSIWWSSMDVSQILGDVWSAQSIIPPEHIADLPVVVSAVARTPDHLDLFLRGPIAKTQGAFGVWSNWRDTNVDQGQWHTWYRIGDQTLSGTVGAVSRLGNRLDLFITGETGEMYSTYWQGSDWPEIPSILPPFPAKPNVTDPFDIPERLSSTELQARRSLIKHAFDLLFQANPTGPASNLAYLEEAYYFVPLFLALQLQKQGDYTEALDWFRTVYDYSVPKTTQPVDQRKIYYGLELEKNLPPVAARLPQWLLDPLNPHAIAATRRNTYTRYTLLSLVQCFLEFADAEFTYDTAESNVRARTLYMTALELLDLPELRQSSDPCEGLFIDPDTIPLVVAPGWYAVLHQLNRKLGNIGDARVLATVLPAVKAALAGDAPLEARFARARSLVADAKASTPSRPTIQAAIDGNTRFLSQAHPVLLTDPAISEAVDSARNMASAAFRSDVALASGVNPEVLDNGKIELPWLRKTATDSEVALAVEPAGHNPAFMQGTAATMRMREARGAASPSPAVSFNPPTMREAGSELTATGPPAAVSPFPPPLGPIEVNPFPPKGPGEVEPNFGPLHPSYWFCTPPNPVLKALRLHTELNLYKLRHCLNIAGMQRQLDPYSAPTDMTSGLPMIGPGGQLLLPGTAVVHPTAYRYSTLVERAKQLVQLAAQMEAAMLSALEKRDMEAYNRLKARQDMRLTAATVQLRDLQVTEAQAAVQLAQLQQNRARIQADHWQKLLHEGVSDLEQNSLNLLTSVAAYRYISAAQFFAAGAIPSVASLFNFGSNNLELFGKGWATLAEAANTTSQIFSAQASYERRAEGWELDLAVAQQDERIGGQQVSIAEDHVRAVGQERIIAQLQANHAEAVVDFLTNKFTNVELYDWMSGILQSVYSFFLREATAMAKLAENQLAFERQEVPPAFIQADYWIDSTDGGTGGNTTNGKASDRRGLTGSARLLQDIYQLDQYAFLTNPRKLQLTKTISLLQLDPYEFTRFSETGVMHFATPMEMFDRDFPGQYLRLIKRVRTSVIALIPPSHGIRATLSTTAASRVVIGGNSGLYQTVVVRRDPQFVALSSPINASGLFELDPQSDMLLPFEGLGVDIHWELRMPKAANLFDYSTIADVLITIEYTALDSFDFRKQVIQTLKPTLSANRAFSFRYELADPWYDLHNPDQTATPMTVRYETARADFPPNLENLKIQHVTLYFARAAGSAFEVLVSSLHFTEAGSRGAVGGAASSIDGMINTRNGNGGSWTPLIGKSPIGKWELALPNRPDIRNLFKNEEIEDILFVITYSGRTPAWPV